MPENYRSHLLHLIEHPSIHGVVVHQNNSINLIMKAIGLILMGAHSTGIQLLKNSLKNRSTLNDLLIKKAKKLNKHIYIDRSLNGIEFKRWIDLHKIDVLINMRTREIFKPHILNAPRLGCINVHHGLLPEQRGTMCDLWSLINNQKAGFSIHLMKEKIDDGEIILTHHVSSPSKSYQEYLEKTMQEELNIINNLLDDICKRNALPQTSPNPSVNAVYYKTPKIKDIYQLKRKGITL